MPIDTISQTISTIPEAGHRGIDVQTQFVIKQEDFQDHLQGTTVTELNTLKTQINTTVTGMNTAVTTVNTKASEASASASSASTSANTATTKASEASTSASNANVYSLKAGKWADNNYNVEVEAGKYSAKHWATEASNIISSTNMLRADKYLAAQNVANMTYDINGKLSKVQYNNATDVDYEILSYDLNGKLNNVAHYTTSILRGNTILSYSAGKLVSAIYTGV